MSNLLAQWVVVKSPCEDVDGLPRERKIGKTITFFLSSYVYIENFILIQLYYLSS